MNSILSIIDNHEPSLEMEVRQYVESIIESALEDDGPSGDDVGDMLSNFLSNDISTQVLSAISAMKLHKDDQGDGGSTSRKDDETETPPQLLQVSDGDEDNDNDIVEYPTPTAGTSISKSKLQQKREAKLKKRNAKKKNKSKGRNTNVRTDLVNDVHASVWKELQQSLWGGRGHGGRGIRLTRNNLEAIHLPSVSLSYEGNELLVDSTMTIVKGHRYGLLGRNGVGKSTLIKQIDANNIPGMPEGMITRIVKQQIDGREDQNTLEALVEADEYRASLLEEQIQVEKELDEGINLEENCKRLQEIAVELDSIDADNAVTRALEILKGLSFTQDMIYSPTINLSGGWRMRLALAQTLFAPYSDLILLDECTNHLDLQGQAWLEQYLTRRENPFTLICVSHDRSFLDLVCTDMIVFEHKRLTYHVGNYSDYQQKMQEKRARESQILDAADRQRTKAMAFVQKQQQSKKSLDPNKQRQAKQKKEKMDRIGNYREDGKRYKLRSLKKLSEDHVRLAQKVVVEADEPVVKLNFPCPTWPPSITEDTPLIQLEDVSFSYEVDGPLLLNHVTLNITQNTKAAVVGKNGCGKTTLAKLIKGDLDNTNIQRNPNIRIGHITQYSVEELEQFEDLTVLQYAENNLSGEAVSEVTAKASGNVRQYLGRFGLGGSHSTRLIGALSGGERQRLCFATALSNAPHMLLLDESTNHVDLETQDSLSSALYAFRGAIIMVSHNQSFLSGFCNELWTFPENDQLSGKLEVSHNDTASFDELFSSYRNKVFSRSGTTSSSLKQKQSMAKMAAKQNTNASKVTALL